MSSQQASAPAQETIRNSFVVRATKLGITIAMLLLIYNDIFGGAIKYYTATSSLLLLSFIPTLFSAVLLAGYFGTHLLVLRIHVKMGLFIVIFVLNALYALAMSRQPIAVGFAFYIWLPFFIGLMIAAFQMEDEFKKQAFLCWAIATIGVFVNIGMKFPWTGESYQVMGHTIEASRNWTAAGIDRLAGFSRASFAAANQIGLFSIILLSTRMNILKKIVIWALSVVAIYYTTSKSPLILMVLAPLLIGFVSAFLNKTSKHGTPSKNATRTATFIIFCLVAIMVLLPVFTLTSSSRISSTQSVGFFSLYSFFQRMTWMWPSAWDLIFDQGNPILMVFGRGLGGIGAPQDYFEFIRRNSADNMFIYIYVTFGFASVFFLRYLITNIKKWAAAGNTAFLTAFALTAAIIIIGITANVIESPTTLLVMGLLIGKTTYKAQMPSTTISA